MHLDKKKKATAILSLLIIWTSRGKTREKYLLLFLLLLVFFSCLSCACKQIQSDIELHVQNSKIRIEKKKKKKTTKKRKTLALETLLSLRVSYKNRKFIIVI